MELGLNHPETEKKLRIISEQVDLLTPVLLLGWAAASEGNAQLRNYLSIYVEKRQNDGRNSQKGSPSNGAEFCGEGTGNLGGLANQLGRRFGANTKLVRGVIGPKSTSNNYLNTIFVKLVSLWGSFKNHALPRSHGKSFNLLQLSLFPYKKGIFCL